MRNLNYITELGCWKSKRLLIRKPGENGLLSLRRAFLLAGCFRNFRERPPRNPAHVPAPGHARLLTSPPGTQTCVPVGPLGLRVLLPMLALVLPDKNTATNNCI